MGLKFFLSFFEQCFVFVLFETKLRNRSYKINYTSCPILNKLWHLLHKVTLLLTSPTAK